MNFFQLIVCVFLLTACNHQQNLKNNDEASALKVMQKHLAAVSNKDLSILQQTLSPDGQMQLILPQTEIISGVEGFMQFHKDWFAQPGWTFETKILNSEVGENLAMMVVEIIYREAERDGKPYFNRMIVSYDLKKINHQWYVIKDHASSIKKSTDSES
ncbi:MAG: nuclear transport factor 2 family protein [Marinicella sp.]|nr:nuclear transport factor 2 family protein [Xanthomonadales bacterium]